MVDWNPKDRWIERRVQGDGWWKILEEYGSGKKGRKMRWDRTKTGVQSRGNL